MLEVTRGTGGYPTYVFHPLREVTITEAQSLPDLSKWVLAQEVWDATGTNLLALAVTGNTGSVNIAVEQHADTRVIVPADDTLTYKYNVGTICVPIPVNDGRDLTRLTPQPHP